MSILSFQKVSNGARIAHWGGCLLGTMIVLIFVAFAIGEGLPVAALFTPQAWALLLVMSGFLLAWWNDLLGGATSLGGIALFYALNFIQAGKFPSGWFFPLCFAAGALIITAGLLRIYGRSPKA